VSWTHLQTLIWLRWTLSRNQWKKGGVLNAVIGAVLLGAALLGSIFAFGAGLIGGVFALPHLQAEHVLLVWLVITFAFLVLWIIGLVTELQRSELLSLDRLLHLPLSLREAFLLNYLSSLASLSIVLFLPGMVGLSLAMVATGGRKMLLMFPLVFGFLALVTAVTYQLRGWLGALMANKRRRRAIIAFVTAGFILLAQAPNLINIAFQRHLRRSDGQHARQLDDLRQQLLTGQIHADQYSRRLERLQAERAAARTQRHESRFRRIVDGALLSSLVVPVGWLPYGAHAVAAGNLLPACWGSLGMWLLAAISLRWSYRSTLQFYTARERPGRKRRVPDARRSAAADRAPTFYRHLPGIPERASTIALVSFRCLLRAPEAKMAMLTPIILVGVFGSMILFGSGRQMSAAVRPFMALGAIGATMFGLSQLTINLFGFDRHGFRAYVLMPVPRAEILLGKNLAVLPLAAIACLLTVLVAHLLAPLGILHLLATLLQIPAVFLSVCVLGNTVSIYAPLAISAGSRKPVQPSFPTVLIHFLAMMLMPVALLPAAASLGGELLLAWAWGSSLLPLYLATSALQVVLVVWLYRRALAVQGRWLQGRETTILKTVAAATE
jgi:hypothetical protein